MMVSVFTTSNLFWTIRNTETFPLGVLDECFLLTKWHSPQLPLSSLQLEELCIISSLWTLTHLRLFLGFMFLFLSLFYLIMILPCNLDFSGLCLLFFMYLKLKNKHHDKKTQQQQNQTNKIKRLSFYNKLQPLLQSSAEYFFQLAAINKVAKPWCHSEDRSE